VNSPAPGQGSRDEDPIALRDLLFREAHAAGTVGTNPIDHHFNVRGIGTVILGGVVRGASGSTIP